MNNRCECEYCKNKRAMERSLTQVQWIQYQIGLVVSSKFGFYIIGILTGVAIGSQL